MSWQQVRLADGADGGLQLEIVCDFGRLALRSNPTCGLQPPRGRAVAGRRAAGYWIGLSVEQILRLLRLNPFERRDLFQILRGDPPKPPDRPAQVQLRFAA